MGPKTPTTKNAQQIITIPNAPAYAIGATIVIIKAIDIWIDDYEVHGGVISERNVIDGHIVADWGVRVRNRMTERSKSDKNLHCKDASSSSNGPNNQTYIDIIRNNIHSPSSGSSPERDMGDLNNLRPQIPDNGDNNDLDDGDDHNDSDSRAPDRRHPRSPCEEDKNKEFRLVNPKDIVIEVFIGKNLQSNSYMKFNNQIRRLVLAMGQEGEEVVVILNEVEKRGSNKYTRGDLARFAKDVPKAIEYDRSIKVALSNWTAGLAQGLVEHGTECGFDAWRKLYNRYVPLADDMQNILIRQLMSIKPVNENEMDNLFDEIEGIREQYIKGGSREGPMSEQWVKAAILQNLSEKSGTYFSCIIQTSCFSRGHIQHY